MTGQSPQFQGCSGGRGVGEVKRTGWFAAAAELYPASRSPQLPQLHLRVEEHGEPGIGFPTGNQEPRLRFRDAACSPEGFGHVMPTLWTSAPSPVKYQCTSSCLAGLTGLQQGSKGVTRREVRFKTLYSGYSECGPWTSSTSSTWELVRNAGFQAPLQTC